MRNFTFLLNFRQTSKKILSEYLLAMLVFLWDFNDGDFEYDVRILET